MVEGAVDRAPEGAPRLPPLGVGEMRSGAVESPVHLGIVGGHRPDIGGRDHCGSSQTVRAAALLAAAVTKIYGSAEHRCTGETGDLLNSPQARRLYMSELASLEKDVIPSGARSRFVSDINGLRMHVLEAGFEPRGRPLVLLLHGFPELAY